MACLTRHLDTGTDPMPFAEPGVQPHYAPDRVVRIVHHDLRISVDPALRTFSGTARIHLQRLPIYRDRLALDLDEVEVTEVTDGAGNALAWEHTDGEVVVRGASPPETVVIRWKGSAPRRGMYFTGPTAAEPNREPMAWTQCQDEDGHYVFPCHDHPATKHPWTIEIDAPIGTTLLSNGARVAGGDRDEAGGRRSWARFEQKEPMPAYLVTIVAAKLTVVEEAANGVPVRYLVPVGEERNVARAFGRTPAMVEHFAKLLGRPYPWPRYDQVVVHDFVFGGMENVACTTMTDMLLVDEKADLEWDPDGLVSHELAHQWFGDLVTCQDWSQGWLNESWATVLEAFWKEHATPADEAIWYRHDTAVEYLGETSGRYRRPIVSYTFREPIHLFDRHLYNKGSCVLWTLRYRLGDEAFWTGVRLYLDRHGHGTVHTRHFQRAIEEATGANLDGFFEQWVHSPGHPVLDVKLGREDDDAVVTVKQTQSGDGVPEVFDFRLRVGIVAVDGTERTVELDVRERERTFVIPGPVSIVRVDPGYRVLADMKLSGTEAWMCQLVHDRDPVLALRAAKGLLAEGSHRGLEAVETALRTHPFHGVRGAIAEELAHLGTTHVLQVLIGALGSETDPRARRAIAASLGKFRDPLAADALIALLREDLPTWQLHGAALVALGQTRDPRAIGAIREHLGVPSWGDWVRQRALEALAETEDATVLDTLIEHTANRFPDRTRAAAAGALGHLADAVEKVRRAAVDRLIELLTEDGFRTQTAAVHALAHAGDPRAESALSLVHDTAADGRNRRSAYEALVRIRRGRTTEQGLSAVRRRLDELAEENAKLRERVDRLAPIDASRT